MQILTDADALVALSKSDDAHHARALEIHSRLVRKGTEFVISQFTILETATVLSYKVSHDAAKKFLRAVRDTDFSELELSDEIMRLADAWFLKSEKKGTSYFDCVNMALAEHYKLEGIFSFDEIYLKNGFRSAADL